MNKHEVLDDASVTAIYFFALKNKGVPNDEASDLTSKYIMALKTRDLYAKLLDAKVLLDEDPPKQPWEM